MLTRMVAAIFGLAAGNFSYQWLFATIPDWGIAVERCWFQATAIGFFAFIEWRASK